MPYIAQERRKELDPAIKVIITALNLRSPEPQEIAGDLNYIITNLLLSTLRMRYHNLALWTGILETAKLEFYRRAVAPYEDGKIAENGDVY